MDAIGIRGKRHIDAIIDEERHAERGEQGFERAGFLDEGTAGDPGRADLHKRHTAGDRRGHGVDDTAGAGQHPVGDEIEPEIEGRLPTVSRCHGR